jgi:hypothetical protein
MLKPKNRTNKVKITSQKHCCNKDLLWSNPSPIKGNRVAVCQICREPFFRAGEQ